MIRSFIAIELPASLQSALGEAQAQFKKEPLRSQVSWSKTGNIHLTLQFLGDVEETVVARLSAALDGVATVHDPFAVAVRGIGTFPNAKRPRVLWVGCDDSEGKLRSLAKDVQRATVPLGFPPEDRQFAAHLTLGRVRNPRPDAALTRALDSFKNMEFGTLRVGALHLLQSRLHPEGSIYTKLSSHNLTRRNPILKEN